MKHLINDYYLDSDSLNFILKEKKISEKTGKDFYKVLGYYGSLKGLAGGLASHAVLNDLSLLDDINKVLEMIGEISDERCNGKG